MLVPVQKGETLYVGGSEFWESPNMYGARLQALAGSGFAVDWVDFSKASLYADDIGLKRTTFSNDGSQMGAAVLIDPYPITPVTQPETAYFVDGSSITVVGGASTTGITAQRHDAQGNAVGASILVTGGYKYAPTVATLADGGFVVGWREGGILSTNFQVYDANGQAIGNPVLVDTKTYSASVIGLSDGNFAVAWLDYAGKTTSGMGYVDTYVVKTQIYEIVSNDTFAATLGSVIDGGTGKDIAIFDFSASVNSVVINAATLEAAGTAITNVEEVEFRLSQNDDSLDLRGILWLGGQSIAHGGAGSDILIAHENGSKLYGEDGDDLLFGSSGVDLLAGGAGIDAADFGSATGAVVIDLNLQSDFGSIKSQPNHDTLSGIENVSGGQFADRLTGSIADNVIEGRDGHDNLSGRDGDDTLLGGAGNDVLAGGAGDDAIDGGAGTDTATYADVQRGVTVSLGLQPEFGLEGAQDTGGAGLDSLIGIENLIGTGFGDTLIGSLQNNILTGGTGDDVIDGRGGNDRLLGGTGNDVLRGGVGNDVLIGDAGNDTADYSSAAITLGVTVYLALNTAQYTGGAGRDTLSSIENLIGSAQSDTLTGTLGANQVEGGGGDDTIAGLDGADTLLGGDGNDRITGGAGADLLTGGAGADLFRFVAIVDSTVPTAGQDTIFDFSHAEGDRIGLAGIDANDATVMDDAFKLVGAFTGAAGQLVSSFDAMAGNYLVGGDVNGDGQADFAFRVFSSTALVTSDFML